MLDTPLSTMDWFLYDRQMDIRHERVSWIIKSEKALREIRTSVLS